MSRDRCKFIVVQMGSRRNYAVPSILAQAGMLERFYTDMAGNVGLGKGVHLLSSIPRIGPQARRLSKRQVPENVKSVTVSFAGPTLKHIVREALVATDPASSLREYLKYEQEIGEAMVGYGFGEANYIFSLFGEGGPFLAEAKRRGLTLVSEVYATLSGAKIVQDERREFPSWESPNPDLATLLYKLRPKHVLLESDFLICPSAAVMDDLATNWGVAPERMRLVPYGIDKLLLTLKTKPVTGRVLFVGTANLNKGIHYLAFAAEILAKKKPEFYEFRVLGGVSEEIKNKPPCKFLRFLGRVSKENVLKELTEADVFVLPSLAEGSSESVFQALAVGVPVITTKASGSVIRDGVEGKIVPGRDPKAIVESIQTVVENRALRDKMARAARSRAIEFTCEKYSENLLEVLISFSNFRKPLATRRTMVQVAARSQERLKS